MRSQKLSNFYFSLDRHRRTCQPELLSRNLNRNASQRRRGKVPLLAMISSAFCALVGVPKRVQFPAIYSTAITVRFRLAHLSRDLNFILRTFTQRLGIVLNGSETLKPASSAHLRPEPYGPLRRLRPGEFVESPMADSGEDGIIYVRLHSIRGRSGCENPQATRSIRKAFPFSHMEQSIVRLLRLGCASTAALTR